jgi:hypothetical protein
MTRDRLPKVVLVLGLPTSRLRNAGWAHGADLKLRLTDA